MAASRIPATEGMIDSFGHAPARDPAAPDRFPMPRTRAAELVERLRAGGLTPEPGSPEELATTIAADIEHFGALIRAAGIRRE